MSEDRLDNLEKNQKILGNQNLDFMEQISKLQQKVSNPEWLDVLILDLMKPRLSELKNQIQNNSITDLNHYEELKEKINRNWNLIQENAQEIIPKYVAQEVQRLSGATDVRSAAHTEKPSMKLCETCRRVKCDYNYCEDFLEKLLDSKPSPNVCSHGTYLSDICKKCNKKEGENWNPTLGDGIPEDARFPATDSKPYNPYDARSILLEPYQVVVEKKDIEEINELNYLSFKEKYLGGSKG